MRTVPIPDRPKKLGDVARAFNALLVKAKMSQADAARALHYSTATISRWCGGETPCPESGLDHLIRVTGMRPDQPGMPELREGPLWLEDWQKELISLVGSLPAERRAKIVAAVRELIGAVSPGVRYSVKRRRASDAAPDDVPSTTALVSAIGGTLISEQSSKPRAATDAPGGAELPGISAHQGSAKGPTAGRDRRIRKASGSTTT